MKARPLPSQEELLATFIYDPLTGDLTRRKTQRVIKVKDNRGYIKVGFKYRSYLGHRLIWKMFYGYDPKIIDHINNNTSDNRISNLRETDLSENQFNSIKPKNNTSGVKGVAFSKGQNLWMAGIRSKGKSVRTYHRNKEDAIKSIKILREKIHGQYAHHGDT